MRSRGSLPLHQLSGGMQQRVMIAMALACNPALLSAVPTIDPAQRRRRIVWPPESFSPEDVCAKLQGQSLEWREVRKGHWVANDVA